MAKKNAAEVPAAGGAVHAVRRVAHRWPAHITTAVAMLVLIGLIVWTGSSPDRQYGVVANVATFVRKASMVLLGACLGYWVHRFFLALKKVEGGEEHDRWRLTVLIAVGMYAMAQAA